MLVNDDHRVMINPQPDESWYNYEARMMNRVANDRWFGETLGGDYNSPGMMSEMSDLFYEQYEKKRRANKRYSKNK